MVKKKEYAWGGCWQSGLAPKKGILDPWLGAQYRPGGKFEEVEKAMFIWSTLFFFIPFSAWIMCVQCLPEVTDSEWLQGSLCSLARIGSLPYMHHQSVIGTLVKKKKKKRHFLGCSFSWISLFKILYPCRKILHWAADITMHVKAIYQPLNCEWLNQSVSSLAVETPLWSHHQPCIFKVVG